LLRHIHAIADIRNWHTNIEQHASEGVNKILIGNKSDWTDKKAVTEEQGRELADEFGIKFMETSAKVNEGVEEAFFTLARSDLPALLTLTLEGPLIWIHIFPLEISKLD
jgi:Ras-related protein Rab-8A